MLGIGPSLTSAVLGAPFSPQQIAGLSMWFRADSVSSSGGLVSQMNDLSGGGFHCTSSGSNRPSLTASAANGQPGVTFDGGNKYLETSTTCLGAATDFTCIVAVSLTSLTGVHGILSTKTSDYNNITLPYDSAGTTYFGTDSTNRIVSAGSYLTTTSYVLTLQKSGASNGNLTQWKNGANSLVNTGKTASSPTSSAHRVGIYQTISMVGHLLDLVVFNRAISTAERQSVERYMGARYAISVA